MSSPGELTITNAQFPAEHLPGFVTGALRIAAGRIAEVAPRLDSGSTPELDATGCTLLPGLIDVHVHGAAGYDTMDAGQEALQAMATFFARHGVTAFLATTMTAPHAPTLAAVAGVAAHTPVAGARLLGVHLEGPYLSPKFPGAQLADAIRLPDLEEFLELVDAGPVRMITLAPEQLGAAALMAVARARGIVIVAGHTDATYAEIEAAVEDGLSMATHTYNAMSGLHHRQPGTLGAVLSDDRIYAQLIADNIHVHPAAMNILARCKGPDRTLLITDAMRATGLPEGAYDLGGQAVTVRGQECRLADGTLAGSVLTLERGLKNFMAASGWPLDKAWPAASRTAAQALGLDHAMGSIAAGYAGDLVLLDEELEVVATIVAGEIVYLAEPARLN